MNEIKGTDKNDVLQGTDGDDNIEGLAGDDRLTGGLGADRLDGGEGFDTARFTDDSNLNFKTNQHTGHAKGDTFIDIERFEGGSESNTFISGAQVLTFDGAGGIDTMDYSISAEAVQIKLTGKGGPSTGGDAEGHTLVNIEKIIGSAHNDLLSTHVVGSELHGGQGDDVYFIDESAGRGIKTLEAENLGTDEVRTTNTVWVLAPNIENLTYIGAKHSNFQGNILDNTIKGGEGPDTQSGSVGNDRLIGGKGDDILQGDDGADVINGGEGFDTARFTDGSSLNLKTSQHTGHAEGDTFIDIERFEGGSESNTFISGAQVLTFDGVGGIDTMDYSTSAEAVQIKLTGKGAPSTGGDAEGHTLVNIEKILGSAHNDMFTASIPNVEFSGGLGNDTYTPAGAATASTKFVELPNGGDDEVKTALPAWKLDAHVERLTYTGVANFNGTGSEEANIITGGAGHDLLRGNGGKDEIIGGLGNDVLEGGADADVLNGGADYDVASYADSPVPITFNFATNAHSGFAAGDIYTDIELIRASNHGDTFIPGATPAFFDGHLGMDIADYSGSAVGVTVDRSQEWTQGTTPTADVLTNVEIFKGTKFDDTFIGNKDAENFIGGAGKDSFDGGEGKDAVWYVTNYEGVEIDLSLNTAKGGDAHGDSFKNIENLLGSGFDDQLIGNDLANQLEGGAGSDVIRGGGGDDFIYGGLVSTVGAVPMMPGMEGAEADLLYGGDGNDTIKTTNTDTGSIVYGEGGNDSLTVNAGKAYGGVGDDRIIAWHQDYEVHGDSGDDFFELHGHGLAYGGDGNDKFQVFSSGGVYGGDGNDVFQIIASAHAYGGEGSDTYIVESYGGVGIKDEGTTGHDKVIFKSIKTLDDLVVTKDDFNAYIDSKENPSAHFGSHAFVLWDWFNGDKTIETFQVANGDTFSIEGMLS